MADRAVVLDTNVFVAAGFNPRSSSAQILERVRRGELRMVWNEQSRRETKHILKKIPPLSWESIADLFQDQNRFEGETDPGGFDFIPDPDDRKFAALCEAARADLITNDSHLLDHRDQVDFRVVTPGQFWEGRDDDGAR